MTIRFFQIQIVTNGDLNTVLNFSCFSFIRLHSVLLLLESSLFGLFVIAIMIDQMHAILFDESAIESIQLKGGYRANRPRFMLLSEVCGRGHPIFWLLPCSDIKRYDTPLLSHEV